MQYFFNVCTLTLLSSLFSPLAQAIRIPPPPLSSAPICAAMLADKVPLTSNNIKFANSEGDYFYQTATEAKLDKALNENREKATTEARKSSVFSEIHWQYSSADRGQVLELSLTSAEIMQSKDAVIRDWTSSGKLQSAVLKNTAILKNTQHEDGQSMLADFHEHRDQVLYVQVYNEGRIFLSLSRDGKVFVSRNKKQLQFELDFPFSRGQRITAAIQSYNKTQAEFIGMADGFVYIADLLHRRYFGALLFGNKSPVKEMSFKNAGSLDVLSVKTEDKHMHEVYFLKDTLFQVSDDVVKLWYQQKYESGWYPGK